MSKTLPTLLNNSSIEDSELMKHNDVFAISDRKFRFESLVKHGKKSDSVVSDKVF